MLTITACAPPPSGFRLPKRLARLRRSVESKRMDMFKKLHETLKTTANDEVKFIQELIKVDGKDDDADVAADES